jgi:hypothetical protein
MVITVVVNQATGVGDMWLVIPSTIKYADSDIAFCGED